MWILLLALLLLVAISQRFLFTESYSDKTTKRFFPEIIGRPYDSEMESYIRNYVPDSIRVVQIEEKDRASATLSEDVVYVVTVDGVISDFS